MKYIIDTEKQTMEPVAPLTPLTPGSIGEAIDNLSEMYTKNIGYISFGEDVLSILRRLAEAVDTLEKRPTVSTFIPFGTFPWAKVPYTEPLYPTTSMTTTETPCAVNQADGESEPQQDDRPF